MRQPSELLASKQIEVVQVGADGFAGYVRHRGWPRRRVAVVASWGSGWEHVSVSLRDRCPTWDEMCVVKDIFWDAEITVMQIHPPKSQYVNQHPYCLHLWRPQHNTIPTPPMWMVGIKEETR